MSSILDEFKKRTVVFDGAMGTSIQNYDLSVSDFGGKPGANDYLVLTKPQVIKEIHESFFDAGCQVVETCTFQSTRPRLEEWGIGDRTVELNRTAAEIARNAARGRYSPDFPTFVSGSMGPTGFLPSTDDPELGSVSYEQLFGWFHEQALALIDGGVNCFQIETSQDMLEARAAIAACREACSDASTDLPVIAQVTLLPQSGTMLLGTDVSAALTTIEAMGADVVGINCSTGPDQMKDAIRLLGERSSLPITCIPNAGMPDNVDGNPVYPLEAEPMALALREFVAEYGVNGVGGCCGTTPAHIRALVSTLDDVSPKQRSGDTRLHLASGMTSTALQQEPRPLIIGERVNAVGSRKMKRLLLSDDYASIMEIARHQVDSGAHVLDVCVALTERDDESEQMSTVVKLLSSGVPTPIMIDSTEPDVIKNALMRCPGRVIVNSVNLEGDGGCVHVVLPLVKDHGAAVVALTIDETGMAHTSDRKLAVAKRIHDIAVERYEIAPGLLLFDPLTFPITTGQQELRDSAKETIEAIGRIKTELPGVLTILGVSNVSFGVGEYARSVLNSVFLHHCIQAGLDAAIVNPAQIKPYAAIERVDRETTDNLIYNRSADALAQFITHFEKATDTDEELADFRSSMAAEDVVHYSIVNRRQEGIEAVLDECLERHTAVDVLNNVLLPAMQEVGEKFGSGELILPFVLESAQVMKKAVAHVEPHLDRDGAISKGAIVLATVFGDVHDIGKNLVRAILSNNGFECVDLGKQVAVSTVIETAVEVGATAIGLSALLVSTSKQMGYVVDEMRKQGLDIPVLVGGAAINRNFARKISLSDDEDPYSGGVFYCNDAFEGLSLMNSLSKPDRRDALVMKVRQDAVDYQKRDYVIAQREREAKKETDAVARSDVAQLPQIPSPTFWGARTVTEDIDLAQVFDMIDLNGLYRLNWGIRADSTEEYDDLIAKKFDPMRLELQQECVEKGHLEPKIAYGYWPVVSDANALKVMSADDPKRVECVLGFPRQPGKQRLCLADYFQGTESDTTDVIAFQVVTVGARSAVVSEALNSEGHYSKSLYLHGLAVQAAEALAEYNTRRIRAELGISPKSGLRYSYGYPACPDMEEQKKLFRLLEPEKTIGVELTEGYQMTPEASTNAIFVPHPDAKYYTV